MMQHDTPEDWVIATGETYTVADFAKAAFEVVNLNFEEYVQTSEKYLRPNEVDYLLGDPSKAKQKLKWEPTTSFKDLVEMMVNSDIDLAIADILKRYGEWKDVTRRETLDGAEAAIAALNEAEIEGRKLVVNESRPKN